jgi:hypothetical protein
MSSVAHPKRAAFFPFVRVRELRHGGFRGGTTRATIADSGGSELADTKARAAARRLAKAPGCGYHSLQEATPCNSAHFCKSHFWRPCC